MDQPLMAPILTLTPSDGCEAPTIERSGNTFRMKGSFLDDGDMSMMQVWLGEHTMDLDNEEVVLDLTQAEACLSRNMRVFIFTIARLLNEAFEVRVITAEKDGDVIPWQFALTNAIRTGTAQDKRLHIEAQPAKACAA